MPSNSSSKPCRQGRSWRRKAPSSGGNGPMWRGGLETGAGGGISLTVELSFCVDQTAGSRSRTPPLRATAPEPRRSAVSRIVLLTGWPTPQWIPVSAPVRPLLACTAALGELQFPDMFLICPVDGDNEIFLLMRELHQALRYRPLQRARQSQAALFPRKTQRRVVEAYDI